MVFLNPQMCFDSKDNKYQSECQCSEEKPLTQTMSTRTVHTVSTHILHEAACIFSCALSSPVLLSDITL